LYAVSGQLAVFEATGLVVNLEEGKSDYPPTVLVCMIK
jgi:hypothetical protein